MGWFCASALAPPYANRQAIASARTGPRARLASVPHGGFTTIFYRRKSFHSAGSAQNPMFLIFKWLSFPDS
jgi:hypothetical protein